MPKIWKVWLNSAQLSCDPGPHYRHEVVSLFEGSRKSYMRAHKHMVWLCMSVHLYEYWSHTCEHSFHATSCTVSCLVLLNCNSPKLFPSCIPVATRMQRFALTNQINITPFHNLLWKVVILIWLVNTKWLVLSWGIETVKFCMASKSCFNLAPL